MKEAFSILGNLLNRIKELDETGKYQEVVWLEKDLVVNENGETKKMTAMTSVSIRYLDEEANGDNTDGGADGEKSNSSHR